MDWKEKLYERYASTQALESSESEDGPTLRAYFLKHLPENKEEKILDLGCGSGGFVGWLRALGYEKAEGVDKSKEQIELGRARGGKNLILGDAREHLQKHEGQYDLIVARDILEHVTKEEALELMRLAREALREGGRIVVQALNGESLLAGRLLYGDLTHETAYTWRSARQLCLASDFGKPKVYPQRPVVKGVKSLVRYGIWMGIETGLRLYLLAATGTAKGYFTQDILFVAKK